MGLELGFCIIPLMYPSNPLAPSNWVILVFHCRRLSLLNFCPLESIVRDGVLDICMKWVTQSVSGLCVV